MRNNVVSLPALRAERRRRGRTLDIETAGQLAAEAYLAYQRAVVLGTPPAILDRLLAEVEQHTEDYQRVLGKREWQ